MKDITLSFNHKLKPEEYLITPDCIESMDYEVFYKGKLISHKLTGLIFNGDVK